MSNTTTGAISGAASGAMIGAYAGPMGMAVGASLGLIGGLIMGSEADEAARKAEDERVFQLEQARDLEKAQREQAEMLAASTVGSTVNVGQKGYTSPTGLIGEMASGNTSKPQTASGTF